MKYLSVFILLSMCFPALSKGDKTQPKFVIEVPAGFEDLAAEGKTFVDLFINGKKIGEANAEFDTDTITFSDPKSIVSRMTTVRNHQKIIQALSKPLATNTTLVCSNEKPSNNNQQDCGYIQPEVISVIFDISKLRADFFINQLYTYTRDSRARFLPPPTISPGFLASLNVRSFNDLDDEISHLNGTLSTIAGAGRWSVRTRVRANDRGENSLTTASLNYQGSNKEVAIGSLPYRSGSRLASSASIIGVRVSSSLKTWLNRNSIQGLDIPITVTSTARVEIFRNDRRIDVQTIEPDQRKLNTKRFPRGSYDITLKITENGATREEVRFYTESSQLPPSDAAQWYFEVGKPSYYKMRTDFLPSFKHEPVILNTGYIKRLSSSIGFAGHFSASQDDKYAELSLFKVGSKYTVEAGLLGSDNNDIGAFVSGSLRGEKWSASARYTQLDVNDPITISANDKFDPFTRSQKRGNVTATYSFKKGRVGLRANYYKYNNVSENYSGGPYVEYDLYRKKRSRLTISAHKNFSKHSDSSYVGLNFSTYLGENQSKSRVRVTNKASVRVTKNKNTNIETSKEVVESTISKSKRNVYGYQDQYNARVRHTDGKTGINAGLTKNYPYASVSANISSDNNGKSNRLTTNLRTGIAIGKGHTAPYARHKESGSFVEIKGDGETKFNVLINGRKNIKTKLNKTAFIPLHPNKIYDISVTSADASDVEYNESSDRIVVYPGNIPVIKRQVSKVSIVVGQFVTHTKQTPIRFAAIKADNELGETDDNGYFQIDYRGQKELTLYKNNLIICKINMSNAISKVQKESSYLDVGILVCER